MWAMWPDDSEGDPAHLAFWRTKDGRIIVKGIMANARTRGREMLKWLSGHGLPIHVVEVIPSAQGFWDRMMEDDLIVDWDPSDGFASPLERMAVPFVLRQAA